MGKQPLPTEEWSVREILESVMEPEEIKTFSPMLIESPYCGLESYNQRHVVLIHPLVSIDCQGEYKFWPLIPVAPKYRASRNHRPAILPSLLKCCD